MLVTTKVARSQNINLTDVRSHPAQDERKEHEYTKERITCTHKEGKSHESKLGQMGECEILKSLGYRYILSHPILIYFYVSYQSKDLWKPLTIHMGYFC